MTTDGLKILLISSEFPPGPGGIGTHAYELARGLHDLGHSLQVVSPQDYVSVEEADAFVATLPFPLFRPRHRIGRLRRVLNTIDVHRRIRAFRPDLIVASGGAAVTATSVLSFRRPWIAVAHGSEIHLGPKRTTRWAFEQATAVVSVSSYTESQLLGAGVLPRRSEVIRNGADRTLLALGADAPRLIETVPETAGKPVILTVGNVTERKGQEVVVRAMPAILRRVPDAQYVAIGLPTDGAHLSRLAAELGVADHVHFTGRLSTAQLAGAFRDATVLAMTSRHTGLGDFEGFGIAAIEAGLLGTPAVVSASGGLPEAVIAGKTGLVVPENDPAATAEALVRVLQDPALAERLGQAASERVLAELTWPIVVGEYDRVIRAAAATADERRPPAGTTRIAASEPVPKPRTLVFISDTPHYLVDGVPLGWASTIREIDVLASLFDEIIHVTPLYDGMDEFAMAPYLSRNVTVRFIHQAGGEDLRSKLGILLVVRSWSRAIGDELDTHPDALVHVRGPSSVAMFAVLRAALMRRRPIHWFKYAGNWMPDPELDYDALSYRVQRWLLRTIHRGPITVNGRWAGQPTSVRTFINPTYTTEELDHARDMAGSKTLTSPVRLLFVGRLSPTKGPLRVLEIARRLMDLGVDVRVDIIGDGTQRFELEEAIAQHNMSDSIAVRGWVRREELAPLYAAAHFLVLPTKSEGFPKVVSEAMSFGAIPLAGAVSSIPQILGDLGVGRALAGDDIDGFVSVIKEYVDDPARWQSEMELCLTSAQNFSFDTYLHNVVGLFKDCWDVDLVPRDQATPTGA